MKITLIPERCIACGLCQTYSDLFDYHDNGSAWLSGRKRQKSISTIGMDSKGYADHSCHYRTWLLLIFLKILVAFRN